MSKHRPPNVILIIMDDLAWGDLACHGNPHTRTPRLDQLHSQSTRLTRYGSGPLCTPARASLMTGRYPFRTRAFDTYMGRSMLDHDEQTLGQVLGAAGYATGAFGKWHLGDRYPMRAIDKGFGTAFVHDGGGLCQPGNPDQQHNGYFDPQIWDNGKLVDTDGYCTDLFTDRTIDFIEQNQDQPFFAYLATNAPHSPMIVGDEWWHPYRDMGLPEQWAKLYGMVENIDHNVGRILDKLDELQLAEDTIVIYTSDHGPCGSASQNGQRRFNCDMRGGKGSVYEGGLRVPCFWRWAGTFEAGRDLDRVANPVDFMPTLASLCGAKLPGDRKIDGADLSPLLLKEQPTEAWPDRYSFFQWHRGNVPIRYHNANVITQRYKLAMPQSTTPLFELYDLENDPLEQQDIAADHPDVVATLKQAYDDWFDDVSTERGVGNFEPPRIVVGSPHESPTILTRQDWRPEGADDWNLKGSAEGHWQIAIDRAGRYSATLRFLGPDKPGQAYVQVAHRAAVAPVKPGADTLRFDGLDLAAGDATARAWIEWSGGRRGVVYLDLEREGD